MWRLLLILLVALQTSGVWAQPAPSPTPDPSSTTIGFPTLSFPFEGTHDDTRATVRGPVSGRTLFTLSGAEGFTARARAEKVVNRITRVCEAQGKSPSLVTTTRYGNGVLTLVANDLVLATVTSEDLDVIDVSALPQNKLRQMETEIAETWRIKIQRELTFAAYTQRAEYLNVAIPLALILVIVAGLIHSWLRKIKIRRLGTAVWGLEFVIWGAVLVFNLWLFPLTKGLARSIHENAISPFLKVWFVLFAASLITNLIEGAIYRYFKLLREEPDIRPRRAQRLETFAGVACKTVRAIMMIIVFFTLLAMLPFDFTPFLTGAGVVGIALGLAAQDILKDLFAGIAILLEDRFGVGDWIEWGDYSGMVESINLMYCQIRTIQGGLVTIPNADLRVVNNLSNEWAQVDFKVTVTYGTDLDKAIAIMTEEAHRLVEDMSDHVLGEPDVKGVQDLDSNGVTLRLFVRTKPLRQWDVERELKKRVKKRFDREGIEIPIPQTAIWVKRRPEKREEPKSE